MNEFEWLQQTRTLNEPVAPRNDLWPAITARLDNTATATHKPRLLPWLMAASIATISVLAGSLAWQQSPAPAPHMARVSADAGAPWKPRDPRLAGAAIELNIARTELLHAIARAPGDAYLRHMLLHTDQQLYRLKHLERRAS